MEQERIVEFLSAKSSTDLLQSELLEEYRRRGWRLVQILGEERARIMGGDIHYMEVILERDVAQ